MIISLKLTIHLFKVFIFRSTGADQRHTSEDHPQGAFGCDKRLKRTVDWIRSKFQECEWIIKLSSRECEINTTNGEVILLVFSSFSISYEMKSRGIATASAYIR